MTCSGNPSADTTEESNPGFRAGFGFSANSRLLGKPEFDAVFQGRERRRTKGQFLVMYSQPNSLGRPRLGLITPKRQARRAVDRNLVKRLVRESFRIRQHELGGFDFVVQLTTRFSCVREADALRDDAIQLWDRFVTTDRERPPSRGRHRRAQSGGGRSSG